MCILSRKMFLICALQKDQLLTLVGVVAVVDGCGCCSWYMRDVTIAAVAFACASCAIACWGRDARIPLLSTTPGKTGDMEVGIKTAMREDNMMQLCQTMLDY